MAGLVQATNGNFYGTTAFGGAYSNCIGGCGTVFEITPAGEFTLLHSFTNYDGSEPLGGLVQGDDGNLYGTTAAGGRFGPGGLGSVFQISPGGEFAMIHSFTTSDGFDPGAGLIIGPDGAFYGTTAAGGQNGVGTVYRITTNGDLSVLNGIDQSSAPLLLASDGNFYGTDQFGGTSTNCTYGCGTVYRITPGGVVTILHSFDGTDGKEPLAGLIEASDGNLYGTTSAGGTGGTVFQITKDGVFTTLHAFSGTDGKNPHAGLVQGSDGNLYGTTYSGGGALFGCVFQITTNGTYTKLISFNASNGGDPAGALVQGTDGDLYGTTQVGGGTTGAGTVFKVSVTTNSPPPPVICILSPAFSTNLVGTTNTLVATVSSNGLPRVGAFVTFIVDSGPNRGLSLLTNTSAAGQASFTYPGILVPGIDAIHATCLSATGKATNVWIAPDSVGDGIPDWWRARYFGGNGTATNSQSCAECDADGTGQNNLFKYVAGLDPTNPASVFLLSAQTLIGQPGHIVLSYSPVAAGRTYSPQVNTDLLNSAWAALKGSSAPTTYLNQVTFTDLRATQATKFYRIGISLP